MSDFIDQIKSECPTIMGEGSLTCWSDCPAGWESLVRSLSRELDSYCRDKGVKLTVDQIKSKFGGLRYYVSGGDSYTEERIREAERKSLTLCEVCGAPANKPEKPRYWQVTACLEHG